MLPALHCAEQSLRMYGFVAFLGALAGLAVTSVFCGAANRALRRENTSLHARNSRLTAQRDSLLRTVREIQIGRGH